MKIENGVDAVFQILQQPHGDSLCSQAERTGPSVFG
jgi:hypothetical protein